VAHALRIGSDACSQLVSIGIELSDGLRDLLEIGDQGGESAAFALLVLGRTIFTARHSLLHVLELQTDGAVKAPDDGPL
jgi:hypothetical protein